MQVSSSVLLRRAHWVAPLVGLLVLCACGPRDGLSDNERRMLAIQNNAEDLKSRGAKIEERHYPIGSAWVVNLKGMQINEQTLKQVKSLGNISELHLSKTTLSDEHMALFNELGLGALALKLDFSHTALTDAGFEKLDNLRFLNQLNLTGTKVTPAAAERFKKKRQQDARIGAMFKNVTIKM